MCFSETASFTAAAVLTAQGLLSLKLVKGKPKFLLLACIPFLFAIQQFSEGIVWHYFNQGFPIESFGLFAAKLFLTFAFLVWPIMIPLSLYEAESNQTKKKILSFFVIAGILWAVYLIYTLWNRNLNVEVVGHHIIYETNYYSTNLVLVLRGIYLSLLLVPIFISSLRLIWIFGFLTVISAAIANYFYAQAFTSVWCFFGALLSLILYLVLKGNLRK